MAENEEVDERGLLPKVDVKEMLSTVLLVGLKAVFHDRDSTKLIADYGLENFFYITEMVTLNSNLHNVLDYPVSTNPLQQFYNNFKKVVFPPMITIYFFYGLLPIVNIFNLCMVMILFGKEGKDYAGIGMLNLWFRIWFYYLLTK